MWEMLKEGNREYAEVVIDLTFDTFPFPHCSSICFDTDLDVEVEIASFICCFYHADQGILEPLITEPALDLEHLVCRVHTRQFEPLHHSFVKSRVIGVLLRYALKGG